MVFRLKLVFMTKKVFIVLSVALVFVTGFNLGGQGMKTETYSVSLREESENENAKITFVVNKLDKKALIVENVDFEEGESLFSVFERALQTKGIEFSYKDYGGSMGVFITSVASTSSKGDKWWQYFLNGKYANVGISNYKPKAGDVIEFRLTNEQN